MKIRVIAKNSVLILTLVIKTYELFMLKKIKISLIIIGLFLIFFSAANPSLAQNLSLKFGNAPGLIGTTGSQAGLSNTPLPNIAASVIQVVLGLIGAAFFILFVYGGFLWMTARGNDEQIKKAKKLITNAVIGLVIIILAYSISYFIINALESSGGQT